MNRPRIPLGRRRTQIVGLVAGAAAAGAAAIVAAVASGSNGSGGGGGGNGNLGSTALGSAVVQRRNLVARDTESGTLSYANPQTVYNRLTGTVTWLPKVGTVVRPGQTLFTVDNRPVLLMDGHEPAFRDLTASDVSGPDVYELNRNLVKLGYNPDGIVVNGTWQSATTAGVDALQQHLGETQTGSLALGRIVFLPGPQLIASQTGTVGASASYHPAAGSPTLFVDYARSSSTTPSTPSTTTPTTTSTTGGTSTTGSGSTKTSGGGTTPTTTTTTSPTTTTTTTTSGTGGESLQALIALLKAETAELRNVIAAARGNPTTGGAPGAGGGTPGSGSGSPGTGGGSPTGSGSPGGGGGGNATTIMQTSSTKLVVTVDLNASLQSEAKLGEAVTVEMPNGSRVGGHVTEISSVAQTPSSSNNGSSPGGGSSSPTVPITVTLDKRARGAGLDQAAVSVAFTRASAKHVLSVPVTALLAVSGNSFAIQEASAPHSLIPVHTGLFAAGYVEISGSGVRPGLRVTDSQG